MWNFAAIAVAFVVAFALRVAGLDLALAWIASCCDVPAFLLSAEFAFPNGDRAGKWPIAMYVERIYGADASGGGGAIRCADG